MARSWNAASSNAFAGGRPGCTMGEIWHSQDGRRGSVARECGYPAWKLVGLDSLGFWGAESNALYEVTRAQSSSCSSNRSRSD